MSRLPFADSGQEAATHKATEILAETEEFGSAASKPAPFAEKKNAKDAAPAKSMRGAIEVRVGRKAEPPAHFNSMTPGGWPIVPHGSSVQFRDNFNSRGCCTS